MSPGRSLTGNHDLLPSNSKFSHFEIPTIPLKERSIAKLTGGVVLWRIWPAVLLHAVFAAIIVVLSKYTSVNLGIPNVLLTLLGVVIGFVISLRVSSGYDRYWWGRCAWSDLVKVTRTMSRLVWIHVPPRIDKNGEPTKYEIGQAMREKRVAIELMEAFAVALKHYLRGELGIYYDDLYHVVRPFHEHHHEHDTHTGPSTSSTAEHPGLKPLLLPRRPSRQFSIESYSQLPAETREQLKGVSQSQRTSSNGSDLDDRKKGKKLSKSERSKSRQGSSGTTTVTITDPDSSTTALLPSHSSDPTAVDSLAPYAIPPNLGTTSYGSIKPAQAHVTHTLRHESSRTSLGSSNSSEAEFDGEREPLLPAEVPGPATGAREDLVPFLPVLSAFGRAINVVNPYFWYKAWRAHWREGLQPSHPSQGQGVSIRDSTTAGGNVPSKHHHSHRRANRQTHTQAGKHRPAVAGDGENLPLEILRCLSEWVGVLDGRGVASGGVVGGLYGCLAAYEDVLATLERILTTPLPYVYSTHISTVWLYLFFLPFQLVKDFNWYTIPGTAVAAFFYLGFIAAGDEIEQPFGYDENDLDLDLFCREIIRADLHSLLVTPFPNAPHGPTHRLDSELDVIDASTVVDVSLGKHHHSHEH